MTEKKKEDGHDRRLSGAYPAHHCSRAQEQDKTEPGPRAARARLATASAPTTALLELEGLSGCFLDERGLRRWGRGGGERCCESDGSPEPVLVFVGKDDGRGLCATGQKHKHHKTQTHSFYATGVMIVQG